MRIAALVDLAWQGLRAVVAPHNYLVFFVTARCNARCGFCFYWKEIDDAKNRNELSFEEIRKFTRKAGHILYLSVGGGEPFLRKELPEIVSLFYRDCGTRLLNVTTNGLQPPRTEEFVARILDENPNLIVKINLSLEAWGERHDEIRGVPGNFGKMCDTYERLARLRDAKRYFAINAASTFNRHNAADVVPLIDRVRQEWRVNDHTMTYIRGDVRDPTAKDPSIDEYEAAVERIERTRRGKIPPVYRVLRAIARTMFRMNLSILRHDKMVVPCVAGGRMLTLSDDGTVKPCEILEHKEGTRRFDFGNLREVDFDLARLRDSPRAREAVKWIRDSKCHCTFECANMCNVAATPKMWPAVLRETLHPS